MQQINKKNLKVFGKRIREIRENNFSSLNQCAFSQGGITSATLSRIENGLVDLKFSTLIKLSYILKTPLVELLKDLNFEYDVE